MKEELYKNSNKKYSKIEMLNRLLWRFLWTFTVRPFPRKTGNRWEIFLLKIFGANIEKKSVIYSSADIIIPSNLSMEEYTCIADGVRIENGSPIVIKRGAIISQLSHICSGSHNIGDNDFTVVLKPIIIEDQAWVAAGCFIGPGVTIGRGARLGAHSVVRTNIPPYSVIMGNPAKIVGFVKTPEEIVEYEKTHYAEEERLPKELLVKNYEKYFLNRIKEIKAYTRL